MYIINQPMTGLYYTIHILLICKTTIVYILLIFVNIVFTVYPQTFQMNDSK